MIQPAQGLQTAPDASWPCTGTVCAFSAKVNMLNATYLHIERKVERDIQASCGVNVRLHVTLISTVL